MLYKVIKQPSSLEKWIKSFWIVEGETIGTTPMLYRLMTELQENRSIALD